MLAYKMWQNWFFKKIKITSLFKKFIKKKIQSGDFKTNWQVVSYLQNHMGHGYKIWTTNLRISSFSFWVECLMIHIYASIKLIIFPTVPIHFKIITKNRAGGFCLNSHFFFFFFFFSLLQEDTHFYILQLTNKEERASFQKLVCQIAPSPSPQRWCTSSILSTDLQMPLQLQSNDAEHAFPAWAFHSQSVGRDLKSIRKLEVFLFLRNK